MIGKRVLFRKRILGKTAHKKNLNKFKFGKYRSPFLTNAPFTDSTGIVDVSITLSMVMSAPTAAGMNHTVFMRAMSSGALTIMGVNREPMTMPSGFAIPMIMVA